MQELFLYIEDHHDNRQEGLRALRHNNFTSNIIAPNSNEECKQAIEKYIFKGAIIDFKLSQWVGENNSTAIKAGNHECFNGIEIAEFLLSRSSETKIGIFSANEPALEKDLNRSPLKNKVELVSQKGVPIEDVNKYLSDFLNKFYQLKVSVKPLHNISGELPPEIKSFLAKKIYQTRTMGEFYWKAGKYAWLVGVNKDISYKCSDIEKLGSSYTNTNMEEEFILGIDKQDFFLSVIFDKLANTKIGAQEIFYDDYPFNYKSNKFIFDYFITKAYCNKYISKQITAFKFIDSINKIGDYAKFESQKILFKSFANEGYGKEEIYEQLLAFTSIGFQKILDIYTGRVDDIQNGVAYIKLESVSSGQAPRVEKFNMDFLILNSMEENSRFEYTISRQPYGGTTSHIELL